MFPDDSHLWLRIDIDDSKGVGDMKDRLSGIIWQFARYSWQMVVGDARVKSIIFYGTACLHNDG